MKPTKRQLLSEGQQLPGLLIIHQDQGKRLHLAIRMRPALMAGRRMEKRLTVLKISSSIRNWPFTAIESTSSLLNSCLGSCFAVMKEVLETTRV